MIASSIRPSKLTAIACGVYFLLVAADVLVIVSSESHMNALGNVRGAKAAVNAMTVGFAHHFGPNVRVNCIIPGPFLTDMSKAWDIPAFEKRAQSSIFLKRGGQADEIVGAALYFASEASSFTTGAHLEVSGGGIG